ncbi:MAG: hypothetical protein P9L99_06745 [Candidatus Lernaella stagnicola]|nr:hypothetical protein [Candidatus Lernaella stagnicola]
MLKPLTRYTVWLVMALWFATGVGGVRTAAEKNLYGQVRRLAAFSFNITPESHLDTGTAARPGPALLALPFYAMGRAVGRFRVDNAANPDSLCAQATKLAAAFAMATALVLLWQTAVILGIRRGAAMVAALAAAFASPLTIYGSQLAPPAFSLLAGALVVYSLFCIRQKDERRRTRLTLGVGLGLAALCDDTLLLFWPLLMAWAVIWMRMYWKSLASAWPTFATGGLLLLVGALINTATFGGPLHAPDGRSLAGHFSQEYLAVAFSSTFWTQGFLPSLKLWLIGDGALDPALVAARAWPAALAGRVVLGLFVWMPLLALGALGSFAKRRDVSARRPLYVLIAAFWVGFLLLLVQRSSPDVAFPDASAGMSMWVAYLIGLAFFVEYHLWEMHGLVWKNALRVVFLAALVAGWGNGWYGLAERNVGAPLPVTAHTVSPPSLQAPAGLGQKRDRGLSLPADRDDAFFYNANRTAEWLRSHPGSFWSTFRPGLNNLSFFVPILILLSLLPLFLFWVAASAPRTELDRLHPPPQEEPPPAATEEVYEPEEENDNGR